VAGGGDGGGNRGGDCGGNSGENGGGGREEVPDERKAYVGNLSFKTRFGFLKDHIRDTAGVEVAHVRIMEDKAKGLGPKGRPYSKGRGVVEFHTAEDCTTAIAACNGTELDGRTIEFDVWETGWKKPQ